MQDLRLALRTLRATPIVTAVAILSLALGIGANTAIFSIVDGLLLRALPVKNPERLVTLTTPRGLDLNSTPGWTYPIWQQIHQRPQLFDGAIAWGTERFNLARGGEKQLVDGLWASGTFFDVLGVSPIAGRLLTEDDDRRGSRGEGPAAVLSYGFWQRHVGGAVDAIGHSLIIEGVPFTVVGITPQAFLGTEIGRTFDVAVPLSAEPLVHRESRLTQQRFSWLSIMARLKPGESVDTATARLRGAEPEIRAATLPNNFSNNPADPYLSGRESFALVPSATGAATRLRTQYARPLLIILIVVALVLLIACANIANLQLARMSARQHEWSVQIALGAPRWRLIRLVFTESAIVAIAGTVAGLLVAPEMSQLIVRQLSTATSTVALNLTIDGRVLLFTIAVMVTTTLLFGVLPSLRASRATPMDALKGHGHAAREARANVVSSLVVAQVALSVVLVVAAGLFVRTFTALAARDLGFEPARVLLVSVDGQHTGLTPPQRLALDTRVADAVRALPGVADAALSNVTPLQGGGMVANIEVSGGVHVPANLLGGIVNTMANAVSPEWLRTLGMPVIAGRGLTLADRADAPHVAVVNEALVRRFLSGTNPLGRTITSTPMPPGATPLEIVGVVGDAVYGSPRESPPPTYYTPLAQGPPAAPTINLEVRSSGQAPASLTREITAAIAAVNPDLALTFRPLSDQVNASLTQERLIALLASSFGALALLLAGLGLYGVTAYAVTRRRGEIGIRMALGADPSGIMRLVLSRVTVQVVLGILVGGLLSVWASRFVASLLYGLGPHDPVALVGAAVVLIAVALCAAGLPAWRASRIDPAMVLRNE